MTKPGTCTMCGMPEKGHRGVHPFTTDEAPNISFLKEEKPQEMPQGATVTQQSFPFDPVLRLALVDKGILTPEDLTAATTKLKEIGGALNG